MAETRDLNVLATEALSRGRRNLIVGDYTGAAEELSQVCEMLTELYGATADQLGEVYLLYGKSLLGCARAEAKLLDITETAPTESQDSESDADNADKAKDTTSETVSKSEEKVNGSSESTSDEKEKATEEAETTESSTKMDEDEKAEDDDDKEQNDEEDTANADEDEDEDDDADVGSLQLAWEVLELSSQILSRKEDHHSKCLLAEVFSELGEVSLESSNFEIALKDFARSLEIYEKMEKPMSREIAEANFKIGLSHALMNMFEEAVKEFTKAVDVIDVLIKDTPAEDQEELKELNQTREEILLKITDVKESKEQSTEAIREQLAKVWPKSSSLVNATNGSGTSSSVTNGVASECLSPQNGKPAADISHLVKRKRKPDEPEDSPSAPKKPTP